MKVNKGFTLIELICTMALILTISSLCFPEIKPYILKDRLDIACEKLISDLRFAKMYAVCRNLTTVKVIFLSDNSYNEYSRYIIYSAAIPESSSMILKQTKLPEGVFISKSKSTFSQPDSENRLIFYSKGNVKPACKITLIDRETSKEAVITLTIGYTRIMKVSQ